MKKIALTVIFVLAICKTISANENIVNGNFSSGSIAPWTAYANASVTTSGDSPFTNVYASNGKCMQINKPSGSKGYVGGNSFDGLSATSVSVNFDFKLQYVNVSQDVVAVQKNLGVANATIFELGTSASKFDLIDGTGTTDIVTLSPNTWYNVTATFNVSAWTYSGSITKYGGSTVSWTNRALQGTANSLGQIIVDEWAPGAGSNTICLDNFSVQTAANAKHGPMLHNGVPYFPIGVYGSPTPAGQTVSQYAYNHYNAMEMAAAGFNNYSESMASLTNDELNYASQFGMTIRALCAEPPIKYMWYTTEFVVGSSFDLQIQALKNNPALLAYYGVDEPYARSIFCEPGYDWLSVISSGKSFVASRDPNHIMMLNESSYAGNVCSSYNTGSTIYTFTDQGFANYTAGGDIYGFDTYPYNGPTSDLTYCEKDVDNALHLTSSAKPIMSCLQGQANGEASGSESNPRPDLTATRFMAYSTIIHGTNGVYWWGADWIEPGSDLWNDIKSVAREVNDLQDVLTYGSESTSFTFSDPNLEGVLKTLNGYNYLIVANKSFSTLSSATISAANFVPANNGGNVVVAFESGASSPRCRLITPSGSSWTDSFVPWGVHVYTDKPTILRRARNDFDADGRSDIADAYLGTDNVLHWTIVNSRDTNVTSLAWGGGTDIPVTGDFDGDGKTDIGTFNAGVWKILLSSSNYTTSFTTTWGKAGDIPVVGDFDGDGKSDIAIFSGTNWNILKSSSNFTTSMTYQLGNQANGDIPVCGDFDGDGITDIGVFSGKYWYILKSSAAQSSGAGSSIPSSNLSTSGVITSPPVEELTNGDFSGSTVAPWQVPVGRVAISSSINSPFTGVDANNSRCMVVYKPGNSTSITATNDFTPVSSGQVRISYDFKMSAVNGSGEVFAVESVGGASTACHFVMDSASNYFVMDDGGSEVNLATLTANAWYNVQMTLDLSAWTYSGCLTQYGGQTYSWFGRSLSGTAGALGRLYLGEINAATAGKNIYYDNFSVALLPITNSVVTTNGDFSGSTISPWQVLAGGASITTSANSPFTNAYANNGRCMVINKPGNSVGLTATSDFAPVTSGLLEINYDFQMSAVNGSGEVFSVQVPGGTASPCALVMDGASNQFILYDGGSQNSLAILKANTWYNVKMTLNLSTWTYSGSLTEYGGASSPYTWSQRNLSGTPGALGRLLLNENNPATSAKVIDYDNFSVIPVPTIAASPPLAQISISAAKSNADPALVNVSGTVSAVYSGWFYIESSDRTSGIRVNGAGTAVSVGDSVQVAGKMDTIAGERVIDMVSLADSKSAGNLSTIMAVQWGDQALGDVPVVGDFDGDGRDDIAVYRGGYWYILKSSSNFTTSTTYQFGNVGDIPICGDYDGDGVADLVVVSKTTPQVWRSLGSASGYSRGIRYFLGYGSDYMIGSCCYK